MSSAPRRPITVALVDDYDVVVMGVANMLDRYRDRLVVAELDSTMPVEDTVDIVLYDSFAQPEADHEEIATLVANPRARRVVVYTWNFHPDLIASAQQHGAHGYLSKTLPARELGRESLIRVQRVWARAPFGPLTCGHCEKTANILAVPARSVR